jgi:serine/threonine-protein kinase RsbW
VKHEAQFPPVQTSALGARRFVSAAITDVPGDISETLALIVSELATNSVRHAASGFAIRVERLPTAIRIEVEDDGEGQPTVRSAGPTDTSGRGLQIVQALAADWGVIPRQQPPGKTVWATVALDHTDGALHHQTAEGRQGESSTGTGRPSGPPGSRLSLGPVGSPRHGRPVGPRLRATTGVGRRRPRPVGRPVSVFEPSR